MLMRRLLPVDAEALEAVRYYQAIDPKLFQFPIKTITALLRLAVLQHCLRLRALFSLLLGIGIRRPAGRCI